MSAPKDSSPEPAPEEPADSKPEVTNPKNLAPVDPNEPREERKDIKAARFETKLRRWALLGFVLAALIYFVWQSLA
ncbi:long-chain fatty acid--CoA ligase [Rothia aerolata]|uniref:Uncharacterized protein n=1 Tax=Rothia aerolata TaxID=1812262 RepID=A0A917MVR1_9MICC|nr:long-chain fatty acid--CoA ligase [Rothia aerolata]GGH67143.1 hypothetical protein GCM10007359_21970 [Rothia aerolata]